MTPAIQSLTEITLEDFLQLPETKPASDYINGVIYQKPMPQTEHSRIQTRLSAVINQVGEPQNLSSAFTELRCTFGGASIVPDIVVFEWKNIPRKANGRLDNRVTIAPDWTMEILSPEQSANRVIRKIMLCLNHGTKLGWLVDPEDESVLIFKPNQNPELKTGDDVLPALTVLTDWQLSAQDLFGWLYS
ncbi:Uma2 family endonuclease [Laspinema sp. D1]|uniref:Uma2 family endonuclease n=1 Tax=Laspinema palackyanum D2a TaxID=2953684 RepID=A0ABT2MZA6_9CYAN|nr:Uma2 family endonuclease [Laspinema sp. D2a]